MARYLAAQTAWSQHQWATRRCSWPLCLLIILASATAEARPLVAIRAFDGRGGMQARQGIVDSLRDEYDIADAGQLGTTSDHASADLGRAAGQLGAIAVISGSVKPVRRRRPATLTFTVHAVGTGEIVASGSVALTADQSHDDPGIKRALAAIREGLDKLAEDASEPPAAFPSAGEQDEPPADAPRVSAPLLPAVGSRPPGLEANVGLGSWARRFAVVSPLAGPDHPRYAAGQALALRLEAVVRFAAWTPPGSASRLITRARYQQSLGLRSSNAQPDADGIMRAAETRFREILLDAGYAWAVPWALPVVRLHPSLVGTAGFGWTDFAIRWPSGATRTMPGSSYRFVLFSLGLEIPLRPGLGVHFDFDHRRLLDAGEVESDAWYGPASTTGDSWVVGLRGAWKRLSASIDYASTEYSHTFTDATDRMRRARDELQLPVRAAAGARDRQETFVLAVGTSF